MTTTRAATGRHSQQTHSRRRHDDAHATRKHAGREHDVAAPTRRADETHGHRQPTRENGRATETEPPATAIQQAGPSVPLARPDETPTTHPHAHFTGAGFFLINTNGWVAGLGKNGLWQDFGGWREQNETPIQTATRELREETGIDASTVRMLAPPYWMRKDEHVYVIHIARVADTVWPGRSNELTIFTELKQFWSGFEGETNTAVHRRVLDRPFLAAAGRIHTEIEHNARASQLAAPAATPAAMQNTPGRHHQPPQPQQHQQHQPHQRDIQRQREQMEHVNTTEAIRRSLADEHGDEDEAIARSIVDEVARQHQAAGRDGQTSLSSTPAATPATTQVRKDSGGLRGEGSATSLDPKTLPRVSGNRNQSAPRDCDRTRHPLSDTHRVMRNASQRGERESRTRLDGPLNAPCGDGTPEGGARIKDHES